MDVQMQAVGSNRALHSAELAGASNGFVRFAHTAAEQRYCFVEEVSVIGFPIAIAAMGRRHGHQCAGVALALCCGDEDLRNVVAHLRGTSASAMGTKLEVAAGKVVVHACIDAAIFYGDSNLGMACGFAGEFLPAQAANSATTFNFDPRGLVMRGEKPRHGGHANRVTVERPGFFEFGVFGGHMHLSIQRCVEC